VSTYEWGQSKTTPRGQVLSAQQQIKVLQDVEARLRDRIDRLKRLEHLYRARTVRNNNDQQRPTLTPAQVKAQAETLLPQIHAKHQTTPLQGRHRILEILREEDAHNAIRKAS
jgi:hypothetical protein